MFSDLAAHFDYIIVAIFALLIYRLCGHPLSRKV